MSPVATRRQATARASLEADLDRVEVSRLSELRKIWKEKLGIDPPPLRSREVFRRMLGYRLQAAALGDLSPLVKRKLAAMEARRSTPGEKSKPAAVRLRPGTLLIREWKGVRHEVRVTDDGFSHDGATYKSLSEVARAIAGSRWNGPLFFGLRDKPAGAA